MASGAKKKIAIQGLKNKVKQWIAGRPFEQEQQKTPEEDFSAPSSSQHCRRRRRHLRWATERIVGLRNTIWRKQKDETVAVCGCGRPLKAGWQCSGCRLECPTCHRALGEGEQCSRCHFLEEA